MDGNTRLQAWRTKKGLTINAAATLLGVDWGAYRHWEAGTQRPGLDSALTIARVCRIPVSAWTRTDAAP